MTLSKQLDQLLLDLAWSLWTELGVAGVIRNHQNVLIFLEEVILLTAVLAEVDPRLRDESLDWCNKYHHFVSTSRLKALSKELDDLIKKPYSKYAATLNSISEAHWPIFSEAIADKVALSHKSSLRPLESAALLNIRARGIFGASARADIITYFLTHPHSELSIAEVTVLGYSKRNLAEILEDLNLGGLFNKFMQGNQLRFRLKNLDIGNVLKPIPRYVPWRLILRILLPLRKCIKNTENSSPSTVAVEVRNCLLSLQGDLQRLKLTPPPFQSNFEIYLNAFNEWLLDFARRLSTGKF